MTILIWVFRALVILIVLRLVMRFIGAVVAGASAPRQTPQTSPATRPERLGGTLVRDPQCGTFVPQVKALSSGSGDSAVFFCSTNCRDAWVAAHRS